MRPSIREPTITRRKVRRHSPKELPSSIDDRWRFPRAEYRRMLTEWEASSMQALIRASDLADEVWHLWLESDGRGAVVPGGSAAAGCKEGSSVHFGSL
eukprot:6656225-Pyramimonas_sp.AAC.1